MNFKLKIRYDKKTKKRIISTWIQKHKDFEQDINQLLNFFKDQIQFTIKWRFFPYYKITSKNPAIILSLFSAIQDLIPEIYFNTEESFEFKEIQ
jgi:hypothetical protein